MSIPEILEFILLPAVGWLLLNSNKSQRRLTRIETLLEIFVQNHKSKHKNND